MIRTRWLLTLSPRTNFIEAVKQEPPTDLAGVFAKARVHVRLRPWHLKDAIRNAIAGRRDDFDGWDYPIKCRLDLESPRINLLTSELRFSMLSATERPPGRRRLVRIRSD